MIHPRRIVIATLFGLISGALCYTGGRFILGIDILPSTTFLIFTHRSLLGFVLGISALRWHWAVHGIVIGLVVGVPENHFVYMLDGEITGAAYFFAGPVYGLVIEFFTSVVFKARSASSHGGR
jgi:hypothetical protein